MADESDLQTHVSDREDTMLYRKPVPESDEAAIADIWGSKLETRVVDANAEEFSQMLADGWVRNPVDIHGVGTQPPPPGFQREPSKSDPGAARNDALEAAEKLAQELGGQVQKLTTELEAARSEVAAANELVQSLTNDLACANKLREAGSAHIVTLEAEIKELKKPKPRT